MTTIGSAKQALEAAKAASRAAKKNAETAEAVIIRLSLLAAAELDPRITAFRYNASWEYDDEGSYYWSIWTQAKFEDDAGFDDHDDDEDTLYTRSPEAYELVTYLSGSIEAFKTTFHSDDEESGEITVKELQDES